MPTKTSWIQKHPKKILTLILFFIFVAMDFFFTVGIRLIQKGTIEKRPFANPASIRIEHPIYHHGLKPNSFSLEERWGPSAFSLYVNSLGFRDKEIRAVSPTTDRYRMVFMGDSFTEDLGMDFEDTFIGIIAEQLSSHHVEMLNGGIGSYSPAIYYVKTRYMLNELRLNFDHMIICLDISDIENEAKYYEIDDGIVTSKQKTLINTAKWFIHDYSTIGRLTQHYASKTYSLFTQPHSDAMRTQREKELSIEKNRSSWTIQQALFREYGKAGLEQAKRHLNLLHQLLSERGISVTLVVYP